MPKCVFLPCFGDDVRSAADDMAAFVRAWNEGHSDCRISTVEFTALVADGMFPVKEDVSLSYRDINAKGR